MGLSARTKIIIGQTFSEPNAAAEIIKALSNVVYNVGAQSFAGDVTFSGSFAHTGTTAGFYGATPVARAAAIAPATDAASAITQLNLALTAIKNFGITS